MTARIETRAPCSRLSAALAVAVVALSLGCASASGTGPSRAAPRPAGNPIRPDAPAEYDVLVGINLLREGLDLPEVQLVCILDADKEGFLRSQTSLVQTIGRAARNVEGRVIMYADKVTASMQHALSETNRRRGLQTAHNEANGINPQTVRKAVTDILSLIRPDADRGAPVPGADRRKRRPSEEKRLRELSALPEEELSRLIYSLEEEMGEASADLRFEYAARLRDEIKDLKRELREMV